MDFEISQRVYMHLCTTEMVEREKRIFVLVHAIGVCAHFVT